MADAIKAAIRRLPLDGRQATGPSVRIDPADPAFRLSLRAPKTSAAALSKALGLPLPLKPKTSSSKGSRTALWLGPDEWLILDTGKQNPADALSRSRVAHAAVDVSHRNTAIMVTGDGAQMTISAGCPQDLRPKRFPVGACSRTLLGKAEIVLLRVKADVFRVECWRSFSPYVFDFLEEAARDSEL